MARESKSNTESTPKAKSKATAPTKAAEQKTFGPRGKTHVALFGLAWKAAYGGEPNWGQLAKALTPLLHSYDATDVLRRWQYYLRRTPGQFASAIRFASTYGLWNPAAPDTDAWRRDPTLPRPGETVDAMILRLSRE